MPPFAVWRSVRRSNVNACLQIFRSHSWQRQQEVLGEDTGAHVALRDFQHPKQTGHQWGKAKKFQDFNPLCHKNCRYRLSFNPEKQIVICLNMRECDMNFPRFIPKEHFSSWATRVLQQPPELKRRLALIWKQVFLVPSPTSPMQVQHHRLNAPFPWSTL